MRTITIEINGDADVRLDGQLVQATFVSPPAPDDGSDEPLRHDTPLEVVIAATCHEANRQYCRLLGDTSQLPWAKASGSEQATNIAGVRALRDGTVKTPEESHAAWMAEKVDAGWTYGPQKSEVAKTHPNLVPYAELAPAQRKKDRLFVAIASALLAAE